MICDNIAVNAAGHLTFAGYDTVELAEKYGTPLLLMDEARIRQNVRIYKQAMADFFPIGSVPEFASKAFSCKQIYRIMAQEGIDIDVVSSGELYTALSAGFPAENCFFHGNNKTDADLCFAMDSGVGHIVVDSFWELDVVDALAAEKGITQKVLLRITPGIDPHTNQKINTGSVDSKFGVTLENGQANVFVQEALAKSHLQLCGFHCHVGSQVFDSEVFCDAARIMLQFVADMQAQYGYTAQMLNLGGGFGVRYLEEQPTVDYRARIKEVADCVNEVCTTLNIAVPRIMMEPGRSLVADAGMTLYTVGGVKEITGYKNYVSVDGGMTDNPRYALYEAPYTVLLASRADAPADYTASVVGRCCESGDIIQPNVLLPRPTRGDILAVLTTGAYNYSMSSNYNRVPRLPVVMLNADGDYVAVRRETVEDVCRLDV